MLVPRPYQEESIDAAIRFLTEETGNGIIGLPTGTGKSLVIAELIRRLHTMFPGLRFAVMTHVKELIRQNYNELIECWPTAPAGIYSAGLKKRDKHFPITFCGVASVAKKIQDFAPIHIVLVDECHLISDKDETMYRQALEELKAYCPQMRVVGLTATPYRHGVGYLTEGKLFDKMICDYTDFDGFNSILDDGYLCPLSPKRTDTQILVDNVAVRGDDFVISELAAVVDREVLTRAALYEAVQKAWGRRHWLVFCVTVEHSEHAAEILTQLGIPCATIHSKLPGPEEGLKNLARLGVPPHILADYARRKLSTRDMNFEAFTTGYIGAIAGVGVFTTGFNFKPVDVIIILRPTRSAILWVQILGRGTRPLYAPGYDLSTKEGRIAAIFNSQKPNCLVLDFAANTTELGPINDPKIPKKKGKKGAGGAPYKICPICNTYNHTRARNCTDCQYEFPVNVAISDQASENELIRREREKPVVLAPQIESFTVNSVQASKHTPRDPSKRSSLLVKYFCGKNVFTQYLCFEHDSQFARKKARDTWRALSSRGTFDEHTEEPPETIDEAVLLFPNLPKPISIRVLLRPEFPEVIGHDFQEHVSELDLDLEFIPTEDKPF